MKRVLTKDGSYTFYSSEYDETFHSVSGALEEAFEKYVKVCKIKDGMKILDVCFGLGYNSLAAIYVAKNLRIIGLEKNKSVLEELQNIEVDKKYKEIFAKIKKAAKDLEFKDSDVEIKIILGDARETIKKVNEKFDAVFFDPFSPPKNPELWTLEFFKDIKEKMKKGGILATYSCARKVRDNLVEAGFKVEDGPKVGRRSPSTVAYA